jgi:hypothetical protein
MDVMKSARREMGDTIIGRINCIGSFEEKITGSYYHLYSLDFTEECMIFKHLKSIYIGTGKVEGEAFSNLEYALKNCADNPEEASKLPLESERDETQKNPDCELNYRIYYSNIEKITINPVFMSTISYTCSIKALDEQFISKKDLQFYHFDFNEKDLEKMESLFMKICPSKTVLKYKEYAGKRWIKYLLGIITLWIWFFGGIISISLSEACLPTIIIGTISLIIFLRYSFKKKQKTVI